MGLSDETISIIKESYPVLRKQGGDVIATFYPMLFERYPSVKRYFNVDRQKGGTATEDGLPAQVSRLANAVMMYAKNIDQVEKIIPAVERIAHRHVARGVAPLQYDAVGECLLEAMRLVLKEAATDEFIAAWTEAYKFLAQTFIDMEEELKKTLEEKAGFSGMTTMTVSEVEDDDEGRILGLVPDDVDVPPHGKGQFLAILVHLGDEDTMTSMNIIDSGEACVRIRVPPSEEKATVALMKVEEGSKLTVSVPCGKVKA